MDLLAETVLTIQPFTEEIKGRLRPEAGPKVLHRVEEAIVEAGIHQARIVQIRDRNVDMKSAAGIHNIRVTGLEPSFGVGEIGERLRGNLPDAVSVPTDTLNRTVVLDGGEPFGTHLPPTLDLQTDCFDSVWHFLFLFRRHCVRW